MAFVIQASAKESAGPPGDANEGEEADLSPTESCHEAVCSPGAGVWMSKEGVSTWGSRIGPNLHLGQRETTVPRHPWEHLPVCDLMIVTAAGLPECFQSVTTMRHVLFLLYTVNYKRGIWPPNSLMRNRDSEKYSCLCEVTQIWKRNSQDLATGLLKSQVWGPHYHVLPPNEVEGSRTGRWLPESL